MTKREQERCDAALSYLKNSKLDLPQAMQASGYFIAGAEWSDKNMLDKACKWLIANGFFSKNPESLNDFIKAMEE